MCPPVEIRLTDLAKTAPPLLATALHTWQSTIFITSWVADSGSVNQNWIKCLVPECIAQIMRQFLSKFNPHIKVIYWFEELKNKSMYGVHTGSFLRELQIFYCQSLQQRANAHFTVWLTNYYNPCVWLKVWCILMESGDYRGKVHIFWEGHKIAKSPTYFWLALHRTKVRWRLYKISWPSEYMNFNAKWKILPC